MGQLVREQGVVSPGSRYGPGVDVCKDGTKPTDSKNAVNLLSS